MLISAICSKLTTGEELLQLTAHHIAADDNSMGRRYLDTILRNSDDLLEIIEDLLDISKFEVPIKTIEDYKRNLFIINAVRFKITLFEGQQTTYFRLLKEIDALVESIAMELKK